MLKVHKFGPAFGLPDASPFVVKVETYLRMTDQPYVTVESDVRRAPRKQLPVLEVGDQRIPDSTAIIEHLEQRRGESLDAHLGAEDRAIALAFKSMLEEHLYFGMLYLRWVTDDGWAVLGPMLRDVAGRMGVPAPLRGVVAGAIRKSVGGRTRTQGMGRMPRSAVTATCTRIVDALAERLGERPFFCGDRPTTYDATVYAFVSGTLCAAFDNEVRRHVAGKPNLVSYADRLGDRYWRA